MGSDESPDALAPADAFSLLADPIRVDILTALDDPVDESSSFTDLYAAVDLADSGKFNYHLKQLVPEFVRKTDAGYRLSSLGHRAVRTIAAGTLTERTELPPFDIEGSCFRCSAASLRAAYVDECVTIDCRACGERVLRVAFPPSGVEHRDPREVVETFEAWSRNQVEQAGRGICPSCAGTMAGRASTDTPDDVELPVWPVFRCRTCDRTAHTSFGALAYRLPETRFFLRQHGVDPDDRPYWEVPQCVEEEYTEIVETGPMRVRVRFPAEGFEHRVVYDDVLDVVRQETVPR